MLSTNRIGAKRKVRFGDVIVTVASPTKAEVQRNVDFGTEALKRAVAKLNKPGIRLAAKKDIPLYSVDPKNPRIFIRRLNGRREKGILENGQFKVVD